MKPKTVNFFQVLKNTDTVEGRGVDVPENFGFLHEEDARLFLKRTGFPYSIREIDLHLYEDISSFDEDQKEKEETEKKVLLQQISQSLTKKPIYFLESLAEKLKIPVAQEVYSRKYQVMIDKIIRHLEKENYSVISQLKFDLR